VPGKPMQNDYVESFNSNMPDELLHEPDCEMLDSMRRYISGQYFWVD
jgi:hypothetical protein